MSAAAFALGEFMLRQLTGIKVDKQAVKCAKRREEKRRGGRHTHRQIDFQA